MVRKHMIFYGRVQGVGFRYTAYKVAVELGLTGYVTNRYDGTVEMEVQGQWDKMQYLVPMIEKSGRYIRIEDIDQKAISVVEDEHKFIVK